MKIAMVLPPWFKVPPKGYGGIEVIVSLIADGLADKGHQVTLCTVASSSTKASIFSVFEHNIFTVKININGFFGYSTKNNSIVSISFQMSGKETPSL